MRKVIQIAYGEAIYGKDRTGNLIALCDDGEIFARDGADCKWRRIEPVPQDEDQSE